MARARNIKPGFFKNEVLAEMPPETRLLFIGLWTLADREGRLEDRPKRINAELFAFDSFNVDSMLNRLRDDGFLIRYEANGSRYIQITNFVKHQDPHYRERASEIPAPDGHLNHIVATGVTRTQRARILERDGYKCQQCGSIEHLCIDHILPVSRGGDSSDENLQVLCLPCNTKKGNSIDSTSNRYPSNLSALVPLIPDSLIPDSLIPDPLDKTPMSGKPDVMPPKNAELRKQAVEVLEFLNQKTGRKYQAVEANTKLIVARLKEGASVGDCRQVIAKKTREWIGDEKMTEYLRPATLFNATKFAQYVGELVAPGGANG